MLPVVIDVIIKCIGLYKTIMRIIVSGGGGIYCSSVDENVVVFAACFSDLEGEFV